MMSDIRRAASVFVPSIGAFALLTSLLVPLPSVGESIHTGAHDLIEVAPGIYAVEPEFAGANAAVIVNEDGVIVVDSHGSPASAATLIDAVAELTDKPIRYVINSHWHVDHNSGNEAYIESFPDNVDVIAHHYTREDIPTLGRGQFEQTAPYRSMPLDAAAKQLQEGTDARGNPLSDRQRAAVTKFHELQNAFVTTGDEFEFTLPNLTIEKSLTIHDDRYTVQVLYLHPAHTRGDLVVYIPEQKVLVAGDILTQPILWTWSSYPADYIRTLTALEALDIEKIIIGHGGPVLEGKTYLTNVRHAMEVLVAFASRSRDAGLSSAQASEKSATYEDIQGLRRQFVADNDQENGMFDQMIRWTIDRAYQEMEAD
jgi:glyoxylase-like metal-dependent hydrolase (beta-lactamase superfamily II)